MASVLYESLGCTVRCLSTGKFSVNVPDEDEDEGDDRGWASRHCCFTWKHI